MAWGQAEQESSHVFLLLEKASEWMDARAGAPTMMSPLEVFLGLFFFSFSEVSTQVRRSLWEV